MAWFAYCITEQKVFQGDNRLRRPFPIEGLRGVGGAQVLGFPSGDLAVIVSEQVVGADVDQKSLFDHVRVVSDCFRRGTVLPFRFGTVFESDEALRHAVRSNRKTFIESVANLRGKAEMRVKVIISEKLLAGRTSENAALPAAVGAEYLSKLHLKATRDREYQTKARSLSLQVHKLLSPIDEEISCKRTEAGALRIDIAHLIDSNSVDKYQNRANTAVRQLKDCEFVVSGPWPPYHFLPGKLRTIN